MGDLKPPLFYGRHLQQTPAGRSAWETPAGRAGAAEQPGAVVGAAPGCAVLVGARRRAPGLGDEGVGASILRGVRRAGKITDLDGEMYSCWHCVL